MISCFWKGWCVSYASNGPWAGPQANSPSVESTDSHWISHIQPTGFCVCSRSWVTIQGFFPLDLLAWVARVALLPALLSGALTAAVKPSWSTWLVIKVWKKQELRWLRVATTLHPHGLLECERSTPGPQGRHPLERCWLAGPRCDFLTPLAEAVGGVGHWLILVSATPHSWGNGRSAQWALMTLCP